MQCVIAEQTSATKVYEKVANAVVIVKSSNARAQSQGSGVAIGYGYEKNNKPTSTWVITNAHVIINENNIEIESQGKKYRAEVQYIDKENDIAELLIKDKVIYALSSKLTGLESIETVIGEKVFAIGSPMGLENSISEGIVSGKREKNGIKLVQTTAAISSGNSGGGLFNEKGELLGITTFKLRNTENINFAIDSSYLKAIQDALVASVIFSVSMDVEQSHDLTKWLLTNKVESGEYYYKFILRINDDALRQKNDFFQYVRKYFQPLLEGYNSKSTIKSNTNTEPNNALKKIRLNCTIKSISDPQVIRENIFVLDEANSKVDGYDFAVFTDSSVVFSKGGDVKFTLNRYTGSMSATVKNNQTYVLGSCSKVAERSF